MNTFLPKCPYKNCKLKCNSEAQHRAIYSSIHEKKDNHKVLAKSKNINYEKFLLFSQYFSKKIQF